MYRIGEFSHLCQTTIKTLRHYDKIDLLKPARIDNFTGYRYYEKEQIKTLEIIKDLQFSGFSLKEIKNILNEENHETFNKQINKIKTENSKKIMILQKMKNNMEKQVVELITNPNFIMIGKITKIKNRNNIKEIINKIDRKQDSYFKNYNLVIENYEKGYQEENINCFIGRIIPNNIKDNPNTLISLKKKGLIILNNNKIKNVLHATVINSVTET